MYIVEQTCHSSYCHVWQNGSQTNWSIWAKGTYIYTYRLHTYLSLTNPLPPSIPQQPTPPPNPHITITSGMLNSFHEEVHKYWHHCIPMYIHMYSLPHTSLSSLILPSLSSPLHPSYCPSLSLTYSPPLRISPCPPGTSLSHSLCLTSEVNNSVYHNVLFNHFSYHAEIPSLASPARISVSFFLFPSFVSTSKPSSKAKVQ